MKWWKMQLVRKKHCALAIFIMYDEHYVTFLKTRNLKWVYYHSQTQFNFDFNSFSKMSSFYLEIHFWVILCIYLSSLLGLLWPVTVCQPFLSFNELDRLEEYWADILYNALQSELLLLFFNVSLCSGILEII